jgi:hypothetical protein
VVRTRRDAGVQGREGRGAGDGKLILSVSVRPA